MEFDYIAYLANPSYAAVQGGFILFATSVVTYALPRFDSDASEKRYLRVISLVAEVLVCVGLLGLLTFAGRLKLDADIYGSADATSGAEHELSERLSGFALAHCVHPGPLRLAPTKFNAAMMDTCALIKDIGGIYRTGLDWLEVQQRLQKIAGSLPTGHALRNYADGTVQAITTMETARTAERQLPFRRKLVLQGASWEFILICAGLASFGVALKCSRAARELRMDVRPRAMGSP